MAALGTESSTWSNRYSTPALHLAESCCVGTPGDFIVPTYTSPTSRRPHRRGDEARRQRPMTFHEGFFRANDHDEGQLAPSYLDLFTFGDHEARRTSGPTIASIKCEAAAIIPTSTGTDESSCPLTPELRLDTSCASPPPSMSPLALVSDFLDTLAGLIHSPSTPSTSQPSKTQEAIMIFDSQYFVDIITDEGYDMEDEFDSFENAGWTTPSIDWNFLSPYPGAHKTIDRSTEQLDAVLAVEHLDSDREYMEMATSLWC